MGVLLGHVCGLLVGLLASLVGAWCLLLMALRSRGWTRVIAWSACVAIVAWSGLMVWAFFVR